MGRFSKVIFAVLLTCTTNVYALTDAHKAVDLFAEMFDGVENVGMVVSERSDKLGIQFYGINQPLVETCQMFKEVAPSLDYIIISYTNNATKRIYEAYMKCTESQH